MTTAATPRKKPGPSPTKPSETIWKSGAPQSNTITRVAINDRLNPAKIKISPTILRDLFALIAVIKVRIPPTKRTRKALKRKINCSGWSARYIIGSISENP